MPDATYSRYGAMLDITGESKEDAWSSQLYGPDGTAYPDQRLPLYIVPPFVTVDPFVDRQVAAPFSPHTLLADRYVVLATVHASAPKRLS